MEIALRKTNSATETEIGFALTSVRVSPLCRRLFQMSPCCSCREVSAAAATAHRTVLLLSRGCGEPLQEPGCSPVRWGDGRGWFRSPFGQGKAPEEESWQLLEHSGVSGAGYTGIRLFCSWWPCRAPRGFTSRLSAPAGSPRSSLG